MSTEITIRRATPSDLAACSRIVFEAFTGISRQHNFPPDFPSIDVVAGFLPILLNHPSIWGVVAEIGGKVVGSNFLDQRDAIGGVGPLTVDPGHQGGGVGRRLMQAVLEKGRGSAGIRLVQDAFNTTSLSLYTSLGFDVAEPLALMRGTPQGRPSGRMEVRPLAEPDLDGCAALCRDVHGFDRRNELRESAASFHSFVALDGGRIRAYASAPWFWVLNHGVAQTDQDMQELLLGAATARDEPLSLLVPTRRARLFRWCLSQDLRVVKPMTLMTAGGYQDPKACFFPSVAY